MCHSPHPHQTSVLGTTSRLNSNWQLLDLHKQLLILVTKPLLLPLLLLLLQGCRWQNDVLTLAGSKSTAVHGQVPACCDCCIL
jgi:hypothetical protein